MDGTIFIIIGNRTPYTADYDKDGNWVQDIHKKAVKGRQMGYFAMVSLWCESLLTNTRFRVLYLKMNNKYC